MAMTINLSILDFKFVKAVTSFEDEEAINLSILDFKFIFK